MTEQQQRSVDLYEATREAMTNTGQEKSIHEDLLSFESGGVWGSLELDQDDPDNFLLLVDQSPRNVDDDKTMDALAAMTAVDIPKPHGTEWDGDQRRMIFRLPRMVEIQRGVTAQNRQNLKLARELTGAVARDLERRGETGETRAARRLDDAMDLMGNIIGETGEPGNEIFYGTQDQGTLDQEIEEVLERHFDGFDTDLLPETIRVLRWRRKPIDVPGQADAILEILLNRLDEDHGDPGGQLTNEPTERMAAAARTFLSQVAGEYRSWVCEPTGEHEDVNVRRWASRRFSDK